MWLLIPPAFVLGLVALTMRFRIENKRVGGALDSELVYSIHRDAENRFHIINHIQRIEGSPPLLLLDPAGHDNTQRDCIDN